MILQLNPPIPVVTDAHGEGMCLMILDYGMHHNTIWVVMLKDSLRVKHYDSSSLRIQKNWTFGYVPVDEKPNGA